MPENKYLTRDRSYDVRLIIWCNSDLFDSSGACTYVNEINKLKRNNKQNIAVFSDKHLETNIPNIFIGSYYSSEPAVIIKKICNDYLIDEYRTIVVTDDLMSPISKYFNVETPATIMKYATHDNINHKILESPKIREYKRNKNEMSTNERSSFLMSIIHEEKNTWAIYELLHMLTEEDDEINLKKAFELCKKYSDDNIDLKYKLAEMYKMGKGTDVDFEKYMETLHGTMVEGSSKAKFEWVKTVIDKRIDKHYQETLELCNTEDPQSKGFLGKMYRLGLGVEKDLNKSIELLKYSADNNVAWARNEYTDALIERGNKTDIKAAFENTKRFSEEGNAWATARLARMYRDGLYVEKNIDKAIELMQSASDMGVTWAKKELLDLLEKNEDKIGIPSDILDALKHNVPLAFSKLSDKYAQDQEEAEHILESIELIQRSTNKPSIEAHLLYFKLKISDDAEKEKIISEISKSSIKGNKDASAILSEMYMKGNYVEKDLDYAILYGRLSIKNDTGREVNELVDKLLKRGTEADKKEAFELCKKSSELGDAWSTGRLARMYKNGTFVSVDLKKAKELYKIAADKGVNWAEGELKNIKDQ